MRRIIPGDWSPSAEGQQLGRFCSMHICFPLVRCSSIGFFRPCCICIARVMMISAVHLVLLLYDSVASRRPRIHSGLGVAIFICITPRWCWGWYTEMGNDVRHTHGEFMQMQLGHCCLLGLADNTWGMGRIYVYESWSIFHQICQIARAGLVCIATQDEIYVLEHAHHLHVGRVKL